MPEDTYNGFNDLKKYEELNKDYKISIRDAGSPITIIAPHGGKIEPGTSDIAKNIAKKNYNCYCFEGIKKRNNTSLHITSHKFDEPNALNLIKRSKIVVAIHACTGDDSLVYLGGLDTVLIKAIEFELKNNGIHVSNDNNKFRGLNPDNICNRGATRKGVQIEVTRGLRDDPEKKQRLSKGVRAALSKLKR